MGLPLASCYILQKLNTHVINICIEYVIDYRFPIRSLMLFLLFSTLLKQSFLGTEGTSLQWRLIASHLVTRLSRDSLSDKTEVESMPNTSGIHILSELFVVLGYFALNNPDNQVRAAFRSDRESAPH